MEKSKIVILLIRHSNTIFNKQKIFRGHTDVPLDGMGLQQAEKTGKFLSNIKISQIYCSPLTRAVQTAEQILSHQKQTLKIPMLF